METDVRTAAIVIARARVVVGLTMLAVPGLVARVAMGGNSRQTRALLRMVGARDVVLGVGAITTLKEETLDAEWVGMGAVADGADAIALALGPGPLPRKLVNVATAAGAAVTGLLCARQIADARAPRSEVDR